MKLNNGTRFTLRVGAFRRTKHPNFSPATITTASFLPIKNLCLVVYLVQVKVKLELAANYYLQTSNRSLLGSVHYQAMPELGSKPDINVDKQKVMLEGGKVTVLFYFFLYCLQKLNI